MTLALDLEPPGFFGRGFFLIVAHRFETFDQEFRGALDMILATGMADELCADHLIDKPKGLYLSSFRCLSAFVREQITATYDGPYPYVDGLLFQVTQNVGRLQVAHLPRIEGRSNYTLARLFRLWLSMFLNFSVIPLRAATPSPFCRSTSPGRRPPISGLVSSPTANTICTWREARTWARRASTERPPARSTS